MAPLPKPRTSKRLSHFSTFSPARCGRPAKLSEPAETERSRVGGLCVSNLRLYPDPRRGRECGTGAIARRGAEWNLKPLKIKLLSSHPQIFHHVRHNSSWHIPTVPREGYQSVRPERIAIMSVAPRCSNQLTSDLFQSPLQLPAIPRRKLAGHSGG